jgi:hypothetical protein
MRPADAREPPPIPAPWATEDAGAPGPVAPPRDGVDLCDLGDAEDRAGTSLLDARLQLMVLEDLLRLGRLLRRRRG